MTTEEQHVTLYVRAPRAHRRFTLATVAGYRSRKAKRSGVDTVVTYEVSCHWGVLHHANGLHRSIAITCTRSSYGYPRFTDGSRAQ